MSELDRIEAMRAAGTISDAEAARLIAVLRELGGVPAAASGDGERPAAAAPAEPAVPAAPAAPAAASEPAPAATPAAPAAPPEAERAVRQEARDELRRVAREAREQARSAARSAGADAADAVRVATDKLREGFERMRESMATPAAGTTAAETAAGATAAEPRAIAPEGTRWLRIDLPAGDLDVRADDVEAPMLDDDSDGRVRLEATPEGARLFTDPERGLLGRYTPADARVRVPRAWGVDLDVKAGDVDVRDVPFVAGRVLAGDVEVRAARGLDLTCLAGDVSVAIGPRAGPPPHGRPGRRRQRPAAARQRRRASTARVSVGDATRPASSASGAASVRSSRGRVGEGTAKLVIGSAAGDLEVRADGREA